MLRARYLGVKDDDFDRRAQMNDPEAFCRKCFEGCYKAGDDGKQINHCGIKCKCARQRADKDIPAPFCENCFTPSDGCYQENDTGKQITICLHECKCA